MKMNKLHIGRFGKLENYTLGFSDGFHVIYGNNEDGKTTLMAFIKMMFYGSVGKSADLSKNIRKKYMPWDGSKMSGSIDFCENGNAYRIERVFGATNATDKVSLWNLATGEKEQASADIGQRFFGIGATAFEKSVFIGQAGSMTDISGDKEDEITQKLLNLVSTGDESVSQKIVDNRLRTAKEALKSRGGRIGVLDKQYEQLSQLNEDCLQAQKEEENKKQLQQQVEELSEQKKELEQSHSQKQAQYELQEKLNRMNGLEQILQKKQGIDKLTKECQDKKQQLIAGDMVIDEVFIKRCEENVQQIKSIEELYAERCRNTKALAEDGDSELVQSVQDIPQEYVEQVKQLVKQQVEMKELNLHFAELNKTQESLFTQEQEKQNQIKALHEVESAMESADRVLSQRKAEVETIKSEIGKANQQLESAIQQGQRKSNTKGKQGLYITSIALASIILVVSVILGIVVNSMYYAGLGLSVVFGITALVCLKSQQKQAKQQPNNSMQELLQHIKQLQNELVKAEEHYQNAIDSLNQAQEKKNALNIGLRFLEEKLSGLQQSVVERKQQIEKATQMPLNLQAVKHELEQRESAYEALSQQIQQLLLDKGCATVDELQHKSILMQSHQTKQATKLQNLKKAKEIELQAKENLESQKQTLLLELKRYQPVETYEQAIAVLQSLRQTIDDINTLELRISSQFELVGQEMREKTALEIEQQATLVREQVLDECQGILPKLLEEWQVEQLKQELRQIATSLQEVGEALIALNSQIKSEYQNKKNVSQIKDEIRQLKHEIQERESYCRSIDIAQTTLTEAFSELQQSFGPLLNEKTASVFNRLTNGKYQNVMVSRSLDINVQDTHNATSHEWKYLSSGTIDQAYLSLRLAVAGFLTKESEPLPLLLDDILMQYDDVRAEQALRFLIDFSKEMPTQVILFTCHKSFVEKAQEIETNVFVSSI